jgi:hypothetical protein
MRISLIVSEAEHAELKKRAGLVPLNRWIRSVLFETSPAAVEVEGRRHRSGTKRVRPEEPDERGARDEKPPELPGGSGAGQHSPAQQGVSGQTCPHGKEPGRFCFDCRGTVK